MTRLVALMILGSVWSSAGDWLSFGGDPQHSGWQQRGTHLTTATVKDLKLLWKLQLDRSLTPPLIAGPTITHRGVRELVFTSSPDAMYAIDPDLGTLFWKRQIANAATPVPMPVMAPNPRPNKDDDEAGPMRPIYAVSTDGRLHTLRPSDGGDMNDPIEFLPAGSTLSNLNFARDIVYAATPAGVWSVDVKAPHAKPAFFAAKDGGLATGVAIGPEGSVYSVSGNKVVSLAGESFAAPEVLSALTVFPWQGRDIIAATGTHGIYLLDAAQMTQIAESAIARENGGIATWQDTSGARWIYAAAKGKIAAFRLTSAGKLDLAWSRDVVEPGPPVVCSGIVFTMAGKLIALDAATGRELYTSNTIQGSAQLAVANGHVAFTTPDGTLYCFGIPIDN